jgi:conjugative transfer region protein TrbK
MKTSTIARISAAGFVAAVMALTAVQLSQPAPPHSETVIVPPGDAGTDPLRAELRRCRNIGQAAASDQFCLRAWTEQRSRFFMQVQEMASGTFKEAAPATGEDAAVNSDTAASSLSATGQGSH